MSGADPLVRTSRLPDTVLALYDRLCGLDRPAHPNTGSVPEVLLGHDPWNVPEYMTVTVNPDETFNQWSEAGPAGRVEQFTVDVGIRSLIPAEFDQRAAWVRLGEITKFVGGALYDLTNGRPVRLDVPNLASTHRAAALDMSLTPGDDGGWTGAAIVRFEFQAHI